MNPERLEKMNELLTDHAVAYAVNLHGLWEDLKSDSPLQMLLRAHLYVEAEMVALLEHGVKKPDLLRLDRMPFIRKVELAVALGLLSEYWMPALRQLNKERNKLAHRLDHQVTSETGLAILRAMPNVPNEPDVTAVIGPANAEFDDLKLAIMILIIGVAKERKFAEIAGYLKPKPGFPN